MLRAESQLERLLGEMTGMLQNGSYDGLQRLIAKLGELDLGSSKGAGE